MGYWLLVFAVYCVGRAWGWCAWCVLLASGAAETIGAGRALCPPLGYCLWRARRCGFPPGVVVLVPLLHHVLCLYRVCGVSCTPRLWAWRPRLYVHLILYDIYISSNVHPSPNSRWLHHTALRYVRRAQSGAYMWWKGLSSVKTGSKRAKNPCLSIPNGPGSLSEKRVFDSFLTHFWSQNGPFSRHFGSFNEPKPVATGSKWAKTTCLSIINGPGSFLEKRVFDLILTHCWSQNGPFPRHFGIFHGPKRASTCSKLPKNTYLSIPSGLGTALKKINFFVVGTLVDPPLAPSCAWAGRPSGCTK